MLCWCRKVIALDTKAETIKPTSSLSFDVWLKADDIPASKGINFVFYYESIPETADAKIR